VKGLDWGFKMAIAKDFWGIIEQAYFDRDACIEAAGMPIPAHA